MPAEQTSTSRPPSSLSTRATAAFSSAERVTSPAMPIVPSPSSSAVAAHARGIEVEDRDAAAARLDAPARVAAPMPLAPPVMRAMRPSKSVSVIAGVYSSRPIAARWPAGER